MRLLKQYWYVGLLLLGTIGLGVTTLLISVRLQQAPVTPDEPHAQAIPTPSISQQCTLAFAITIPATSTPVPTAPPGSTNTPIPPTDTPVPTSPPGATDTPIPTNPPNPTNTPIPTNTPVPPTNTYVPATNTPIPTSTNTPTPTPASCNQYCTGTNDGVCTGGLTCSGNYCKNPSCTNVAGCTCPSPTPTPSNTPAPGACSAGCTTNGDCLSPLICDQSSHMCRNVECTDQPNCACYFVPTPKVPVTGSGTTVIGIGVIGGGILLLLLGLAF